MWVTNEIRTSSEKKRRLCEEIFKGTVSSKYYSKYILKQVVRQAKKISPRDHIGDAENKGKATWTIVDNIFKENNNSEKYIF